MELTLKRIARKPGYTIGRLYVDGAYFCDTLEDTARDLSREPKRPGATAIPEGTYPVSLTAYSPKFGARPFYRDTCGGRLPRLLGVPGFEGILIHCGNTAADTAGCILVGRNTAPGRLADSQAAFAALVKMLKEPLAITIQ